ncbi:hypothetical protein [Microvirga tunisiensis]|nr:hypothetical protein [Microvirga tunisiensis]
MANPFFIAFNTSTSYTPDAMIFAITAVAFVEAAKALRRRKTELGA